MDQVEHTLRAMIREMVREELRAAREAEIESDSEYMTAVDAASFAQVSVPTIRRWMREGRLAKYGAGREVRVSRGEISALMQKDNSGRARPTLRATGQSRRQSSPEDIGDSIARTLFAGTHSRRR